MGSYELYRKFDSSGNIDIERSTVHVSDDTGRIAMLETLNPDYNSDGSEPVLTRYIYSNHLQSASLELDEDGEIISYEEYHPYGTTAYQAINASIKAVAKRYRYTGKERDEESGLYYHGARYYAPWLARWTAVDPINSENYNIQRDNPQRNKERGFTELTASPYEYCFDNPVRFNDPTGEQPPNKSNLNFNIGMVIGTHNMGFKMNTSYTQKLNNWELSAGGSATYYAKFSNTGKTGFEFRGSVLGGFNDNHSSFTLGRNWFVGVGGMSEFKQSTGIMNIGIGKFKLSYENDGMPFNTGKANKGAPWLSDGNDSYRTAAVRVGYDKASFGFNLLTGKRTNYKFDEETMKTGRIEGNFGTTMPWGYVQEEGDKYRMGALYIGYDNLKIGIDSDKYVRHPIQDEQAHNWDLKLFGKTLLNTQQPGFETLSDDIKPYIQYNSFPIDVKMPNFTLYKDD